MSHSVNAGKVIMASIERAISPCVGRSSMLMVMCGRLDPMAYGLRRDDELHIHIVVIHVTCDYSFASQILDVLLQQPHLPVGSVRALC